MYLCTQANNSIIHNSQKVEGSNLNVFTGEWINKMWHIHITEYYSAYYSLKGKKF